MNYLPGILISNVVIYGNVCVYVTSLNTVCPQGNSPRYHFVTAGVNIQDFSFKCFCITDKKTS